MAPTLPPDVEASVRVKVDGKDRPTAGDEVRETLRVLDGEEHRPAKLRVKLQPAIDQLDRGEGISSPRAVSMFRTNDPPPTTS